MKWPFARQSKQGSIPDASNVIGAKTVVKGDLKGDGFRIDGTVDGFIDSNGPVYIGESGMVTGCVRATDLVVLGRVEGDIEATGHLRVGEKGSIIGDITVQSFDMNKGGIFRGVSRMADAGAVLALPHSIAESDDEHDESSEAPTASEERLIAGADDSVAPASEKASPLRRVI